MLERVNRIVAYGCKSDYACLLSFGGALASMLSSIFIALFQAAAGDPAAVADAEMPAAEATETASPAAPTTERRRVCTRESSAGTGRRIPQRRCRYEDETPAGAATAPTSEVEQVGTASTAETPAMEAANTQDSGGGSVGAAPAPTASPTQSTP